MALLALHLAVGPLVGLFAGSALIGIAFGWPEDLAFSCVFWTLLGAGMALGVLPSSLAAIAVGARHGLPGLMPYLAVMALACWGPWQLLRGALRSPLRQRLDRNPQAVRLLALLDRAPWLLLFGMRLAPIAVFSWTNALFALSRLRAAGYLSASVLGALPRAAALMAAGAGARDFHEALSQGRTPIVSTLLLAAGIAGILVIAGVVGSRMVARIEGEPPA